MIRARILAIRFNNRQRLCSSQNLMPDIATYSQIIVNNYFRLRLYLPTSMLSKLYHNIWGIFCTNFLFTWDAFLTPFRSVALSPLIPIFSGSSVIFPNGLTDLNREDTKTQTHKKSLFNLNGEIFSLKHVFGWRRWSRKLLTKAVFHTKDDGCILHSLQHNKKMISELCTSKIPLIYRLS